MINQLLKFKAIDPINIKPPNLKQLFETTKIWNQNQNQRNQPDYYETTKTKTTIEHHTSITN